MSSRKNQQNLNLSGFSPIQLNIKSPISAKSPAKDYGINEKIQVGQESLISGFDRWKLAEINGAQCVNIMHNLKDKTRRSNESPYPPELEAYCKKLETIKTVFEDVLESAVKFRKEVIGSSNILESLRDNEELQARLDDIQKFLDVLIKLYETNLQTKLFVVENIAHAKSSQDSHILLASWSFDSHNNEIFRLIAQLKVSPPDHQWIVS